MCLETITRIYTVLLLLRGTLFLFIFSQSSWTIWRNHLEHRVRLLLWGTAAMTFFTGLDNLWRGYGRAILWVQGIDPVQPNPKIALLTLFLSNVGVILWMVALDMTAKGAFVPPGTPLRRESDPDDKED